MKVVNIGNGTDESAILIGEGLNRLETYLPGKNPIIITDTNVRQHYRKFFPDGAIITIGIGENQKNLDTVRGIYEQLLALEADRSSFIVGIGGGIVCDMAGFVACTYLRGLRFGFVSTTLLSQVDASVGGKNGVNFGGYKNMIGVFHQPEFVICDLNVLRTLPQRDLLCGFAEIVKHAAIADKDMFAYLEDNSDGALSLDMGVIEKLVYDSVVIKAAVVNGDEKEKGERRKLNFGHTVGHALEKTTGISHGEAVSAGMVQASALSVKRGLLPGADADRIRRLLEKLRLPTRIEADSQMVLDAIHKDKKRQGDRIHFVLLRAIGHAVVEEIPLEELKELITYN